VRAIGLNRMVSYPRRPLFDFRGFASLARFGGLVSVERVLWYFYSRADVFIISTAIERVALDWGRPSQRFVDRMTLGEAKAYLAEGTHFAAGSMAPKIEACIDYLERGGGEADRLRQSAGSGTVMSAHEGTS